MVDDPAYAVSNVTAGSNSANLGQSVTLTWTATLDGDAVAITETCIDVVAGKEKNISFGTISQSGSTFSQTGKFNKKDNYEFKAFVKAEGSEQMRSSDAATIKVSK